jgi:hypothetical protein
MMYIVSVTGSAVTVEVEVAVVVAVTVVVTGGNGRDACCGLLSAVSMTQLDIAMQAVMERARTRYRENGGLVGMGPR